MYVIQPNPPCSAQGRLLLGSTMQFVGQQFTSANKRSRLGWLTGSALLLLAGSTSPVSANVTIVKEDFTDSTAYGWTVGGTGARCLILTMGRRESLVG
jgi:hypothetical protein